MALQESLLTVLACPSDHGPLRRVGDKALECPSGHRFPVVKGIPVLLTTELAATHPYFAETLATAGEKAGPEPSTEDAGPSAVDPFVQDEIIRTNGNLYRHLLGRLPRYPIPELRLAPGNASLLLDVGCNWGRWTLAAARQGYRPIGLDPSLEACLAGRRVAQQLGLDAAFVVGDARRLPFPDGILDVVFSYSVLQHFDKADARLALSDMGRVLRREGAMLVQMPNVFGVRQLFNRTRQILRRERNLFRVRYWTPSELIRTFEGLIGRSCLSVDGFFSLNPQATDLDLLTPARRRVVRASEFLRRLSRRAPALATFADSLYVHSVKGGPDTP